MTEIAIKALQRTICATGQNFQIKEQRDFIMEGLFRAISINNEGIQSTALEALSEVPQLGYEFLVEYIEKIGEITIKFIDDNSLV